MIYLLETFQLNTVTPIMMTKALLPLLKKASHYNSTLPMCISKALIINMSSLLGSIAANVQGGMYNYRTAKSGLNAATKSMSIDLKGDDIMAISFHPGWVRTDMGGQNAPLDVETSCSEIVETIFKLKGEDNGGFIQYDGKKLEW